MRLVCNVKKENSVVWKLCYSVVEKRLFVSLARLHIK